MASNEPEKINLDVFDTIAHLPPAPVMLVASGDREENWNVTTIGMFNVFSLFPVVVGIGVKTSRNIYRLLADSDDFTINIPSADLVEKVEACGREAGVKTNKFKLCGLTPVKGERVKSPIIQECWLNIECRKLSGEGKKTVHAVRMSEFDVGDHTWFLGQIVHTDVWKNYDRNKSLLFWNGEYRLASELVKGGEA